jgi:hypothetical protein
LCKAYEILNYNYDIHWIDTHGIKISVI